MANTVSKSNVSVAAVKKRNHALPQKHVTTASFMNFDVTCARELVPGTHLVDNHRAFIRTDPLRNPCLGSLKVHSRAFFVPFRTVWQSFNSFINDVPFNSGESVGLIPNVPTLDVEELTKFFTGNGNSVIVEDPNSSYDYEYDNVRYRFTAKGRWNYKFMKSLGYNWWPYYYQVGDVVPRFSALPLLCALKVYLDYYFPDAYAHTQEYIDAEKFTRRQGTFVLMSNDINLILYVVRYVCYEPSVFTTAWDRPVGPNSDAGSLDFVLPDVTRTFPIVVGNTSYTLSGVSQDDNGTPSPFIYRPGAPSTNANHVTSQYVVDGLKALTDYVKRHQLAGSRVLQRALAAFGVTLSVEKLNRCVYLGSDDFPIQIGDVMSTAETSEASLGAYAGKAVGVSNGHQFECDTDEFGYYLVITSIVPDVAYVEGYDYNTTHISKLDFFTPEFDMLGVRMMERGEVIGGLRVGTPANSWQLVKQRFGFVPRYAEYRYGRDCLTGDFVVPSFSKSLDGWYTARDLYLGGGTGDYWLTNHSYPFMLGEDSGQFMRLFGIDADNIDDYADPFYCVHSDDIMITSPMKHLYDSYEFENEDESHRTVQLDAGSRLN